MFARSDSLLLSIPTSNFFQQQQPHFDFRPMRSTEPEIFTFERIPETQQPFAHRGAPVRPRKRNTRVMYPAQVRKYLPPVEKSRAKRWLFILCLVVFMQIYTEEGTVESTQAEGPACTDATTYNVLSFQSAEEQARQMMGMSDQKLQVGNEEKESLNQFLNTSCPSATCEDDVTALYQQSRRSGYVVALLYPVYHRLGTEK
ncbi:radiation-inducible immediate-early gene IEX-1 [Misgurnus anguillicaudatus]|uniref:radiation-inducible immediate-early gene IEX-1 n=1 Tax=Misgurnus anguillicaudatus TaxID=75329 RepID=UPI00243480C7|nr:radiation-inducible immediate-early gene IEX-1 [Misgurnus anguillicaudatus]